MRIALLLLALALAGCRRTPPSITETRPEWRGAAIEGIAPLMAPDAVQAALDRGGYRQTRCTAQSPLLADPLHHGEDMPCFQAPGRPTRIKLYFLDLKEGRRLAIAFFSQPLPDLSDSQRAAAAKVYAAALRRRFGRPAIVSRQPDFASFYWRRPGGRPTLPDLVVTTLDGFSGPNVELRSLWAYGQVRPRALSPGSR